jgi:hypothetical protein
VLRLGVVVLLGVVALGVTVVLVVPTGAVVAEGIRDGLAILASPTPLVFTSVAPPPPVITLLSPLGLLVFTAPP